VNTKTCTKCGIEKPVIEFRADFRRAGSLRSGCKTCDRAYTVANREKHAAYQAAYAIANPEKITAYLAANCKRIAARKARYQAANRKRIASRKAAHYVANREKIAAYNAERRRADPAYAMVIRLRARVRQVLYVRQKAATTMELLGCTRAEFLAHIEAQFQPGMTWENRSLWHIDHIHPCASFDLLDPEHQRICFHYTNLQPLWAADNLKKSASVPAT